MKRNPEAVCDTCPYWSFGDEDSGYAIRHDLTNPEGDCRLNSPVDGTIRTARYFWCGEHPDFEALLSSVEKGQHDP